MKNAFSSPILCVIAVLFGVNLAQSAPQQLLGGYAGFVERMGAGAREIAMGQTGVADEFSSFVAYRNPALSSAYRKYSLDLFGEQLELDRQGAALGFQAPVGSKMGLAGAWLYRGDSKVRNIDDNDVEADALSPYWSAGFVSGSWRLSFKHSLGLSYHWQNIHYGFDNLQDYNSPGAFSLGWLARWSEHWQSAVVIRQLGLNSGLSARYHPTFGSGSGLDGGDEFFPKVFHFGVTWKDSVLGKPFQVNAEIQDYQLADSLFTFDGDRHAVSPKIGAESELIPQGFVRLGYDDGDYALGVGYEFGWQYSVQKRIELRWDWAMRFERNVNFFNPVTTGFKLSF